MNHCSSCSIRVYRGLEIGSVALRSLQWTTTVWLSSYTERQIVVKSRLRGTGCYLKDLFIKLYGGAINHGLRTFFHWWRILPLVQSWALDGLCSYRKIAKEVTWNCFAWFAAFVAVLMDGRFKHTVSIIAQTPSRCWASDAECRPDSRLDLQYISV